MKAELIKLYSIFSNVKCTLLYIFTFLHVKIYIFQIYIIIFNKYFPCILLLFIQKTLIRHVTSEHITGIMGISV